MPHIHNGEGEHDLTASAFIVKENKSNDNFVFLMHKHRKIDKILQPGGHVELTENPFQAVVREVLEETGYEPEQLILMQRSYHNGRLTMCPPERVKEMVNPQPFYVNTHQIINDPLHFHTDLSYVFFVTEPPKSKPLPGESLEFFWLSEHDIVFNNMIPRNIKYIIAQIANQL